MADDRSADEWLRPGWIQLAFGRETSHQVAQPYEIQVGNKKEESRT
jgi:hypothetical protein